MSTSGSVQGRGETMVVVVVVWRKGEVECLCGADEEEEGEEEEEDGSEEEQEGGLVGGGA